MTEKKVQLWERKKSYEMNNINDYNGETKVSTPSPPPPPHPTHTHTHTSPTPAALFPLPFVLTFTEIGFVEGEASTLLKNSLRLFSRHSTAVSTLSKHNLWPFSRHNTAVSTLSKHNLWPFSKHSAVVSTLLKHNLCPFSGHSAVVGTLLKHNLCPFSGHSAVVGTLLKQSMAVFQAQCCSGHYWSTVCGRFPGTVLQWAHYWSTICGCFPGSLLQWGSPVVLVPLCGRFNSRGSYSQCFPPLDTVAGPTMQRVFWRTTTSYEWFASIPHNPAYSLLQ